MINRQHAYLYAALIPLGASVAIQSWWAVSMIAVLAIRQAIICAILSAREAQI